MTATQTATPAKKTNGATAPRDETYHPALGIALLHYSATNPRKHFDANALAELTLSIQAKGVLQPVIVRPHPARPHEFELVVGERRLRAAKAAGLDTIPATERALTDLDVLEIQIIENDQREDVHPLEEAEGFERLLKSAKADGTAYTPEDIVLKIGKSRTYVYNRLKLIDLCEPARAAYFDGAIDLSKAQLLARLGHADTQRAALKEIIKTGHDGSPLMTTREARAHIERSYMLDLQDAVFDPKISDYQAKGKPIAGACGPCPKRSGNNPDLFGDVKGKDICTDVKCFHAKRSAHFEREAAAFAAKGLKVITGNEAKKILPDRYSPGSAKGDYIGASQYCNEAGKNYEKIIGKQIAPVMVRHPDRNEFVKVFPLAEVKKILKAQDIKAPAAGNGQGAFQAAAAKANAKSDLDDRVRSEAYLAVRARIATGLSEPDWRLLATMTCNALFDAGDFPDMLVDLYAKNPGTEQYDYGKARRQLHRAIELLQMAAIPRFIFDCAHESIVNGGYGTPDDVNALDALFTRYGLDQKAIRARLVKEDKAKAATAAATKKPTPPAGKGAKP